MISMYDDRPTEFIMTLKYKEFRYLQIDLYYVVYDLEAIAYIYVIVQELDLPKRTIVIEYCDNPYPKQYKAAFYGVLRLLELEVKNEIDYINNKSQ